MRIPEIADRLRDLAAEQGLPELAGLAAELRRRPPRHRAEATSRAFTPELAAEIRAYKAGYPELSQVEVARAFQVNPGRVSEALRGKRA